MVNLWVIIIIIIIFIIILLDLQLNLEEIRWALLAVLERCTANNRIIVANSVYYVANQDGNNGDKEN